MKLPIINGANEGIQFNSFMEALCAFKPDGWLHKPTRFGPTGFAFLNFCWPLSIIGSILLNLKNVFQHINSTTPSSGHQRTISAALWHMTPILFTAGLFQVWALTSPSDVATRQPFLFMGFVHAWLMWSC